MTTVIVEKASETQEQSFRAAQDNAAQLDSEVKKLRQLQLWQSFGTIGYDGYMSWVLSDRTGDVELFG